MGIDIYKAIDELKEKRKCFCSEADFQLELAWTLKKLYGEQYKIRLEYVYVLPKTIKKLHIDIMLIDKLNNKIIPVELKYKTKGCKVEMQDENYDLANHGAQPGNCYLYLKDIARIESICEYNNTEFEEGYAIMLTNDISYMQKGNKPGIAEQFSLHEGAERCGEMNWIGAGKWAQKDYGDKLSLKNKYIMHWLSYSEIKSNKKKANNFYILINKIIKEPKD